MEQNEGKSNALSVSAAMGLAKSALEGVVINILGEVSEVSINARYKAVYFTIKDEKSSLPCMMWNNRYSASGVQLNVGAMVELSGRFTLYAAKGRMNFDVFSISLAGEGMLRMQVANLAARLKAEGLFDSSRKKVIPAIPERIGLVTSPRGAAVHDVLRTLRRRLPLSKVLFAGVPVEGNTAPSEIACALKLIADRHVDVILLVRGGGSFEDLMPFNDEMLVRTIASLDVPIVTGIGHEPDTSIADMAADLRASTPTAAAEAVSASADAIRSSLDSMSYRMHHVMERKIGYLQSALDSCSLRLPIADPMRILEPYARSLDEISSKLEGALPSYIASMQSKLILMRYSLLNNLKRVSAIPRRDLATSAANLQRVGHHILDGFYEDMALSAARLNDLSPLSVVARGYSIAINCNGALVTSVKQIDSGDKLEVMVSDGYINCSIDKTREVALSLENLKG
ncbi:exodeoxyribonuclease VII large subunit [Adlercreutzia sp. ZJ304]|uniref:exodeoxyribonuclease VII large subunit n=1 Tax=Adlercreutzia sp. ZJ304 TaxID=2709791 RepID=UPI0013EC641E|nr:exodeoxyribonuclease VII large subunit [Adlercreutzia sp. ZJ304]